MALGILRRVGVETPTFDPQYRLVTSPFFSPGVLAGLRLLLGFYLFIACVLSLVWRAVVRHDAERYLSYFTNLTGIGLCAYLLHAGWLTAAYAFDVRRGRQSPSYPLQHWPRSLQAMHLVLLASVRTLPIIVTVVFWTLLSGDGTLATAWGRYTNISMHLFNSLFALFEMLATHTPPSAYFNLIFMTLILGAYVGVAYITHAKQHFYPYAFLDPKHGAKLAIYIVGIPIANAFVFCAVNGLIWLRMRFAPKLKALDNVNSTQNVVEIPMAHSKADDESTKMANV